MMPLTQSPLTTPSISPDEFARQLTLDGLAAAADSAAAGGRALVCVARVNREQEAEGGAVAERSMLLPELALFIRRNLRGTDALAIDAGGLVILLGGAAPQDSVIRRVLGAVGRHAFAVQGRDAIRLTLSVGVASAPEHGTTFSTLWLAARSACAAAPADGFRRAFANEASGPDFSRFIGRAEQLALLTNSLDDMVRGAGRVVAMLAERGVGTSALICALTPEVRARHGSLVVASCRPRTYVAPYDLWIEVIRGVRRLPIKSTRQWRELSSLDPTLEQSPSVGGAGSSKTQLLEELADFLRLAAQQRPLVVALENLHHADAASWDALEYLVTQMESERILFVLTMEPGGAIDAQDRWAHLASRPRHAEIRLTHFTRDDVKRWIETVLRPTEPGRELLSYVYRHSEGNPLMLVHLVRDLVEGGHLVAADGAWLASPISELPVTTTLDDLLERRIARLPVPAQELLQVASIFGRELSDSHLAGSALDVPSVRRALDDLVTSGFLVRTYDRGAAAYTVAHEEVARVARKRLSDERASDFHRILARVLATAEPQAATEITHHYERAGNLLEAHKFALRAADRALAVYETNAASDLLAIALRTAPSEEESAEVRVRMARLAEEAGRYEEAEELCNVALEWYERQNDRTRALTLKRTRALVRMKRGQAAQETLEVLLTLETEAHEVGADTERGAVLLLIAQMHWRLGDIREAQRTAEEAVEIARLGDDEILLADACNRLAVTLQLENEPRARELFMTALEISTARGDAFRRVRGLNNLGILEIFSNNTEEAWRVLTIAVEQARTAGIIESWGRAELNLGVLAGRIGDYKAAGRAFSEALRLTSMVQNSEEQLYATYNLAHLERDNDRPREAADTYELVVDLAERIGQVPIQAGAYGGLGLSRLALGDVDGAVEALRMGELLTDRIGAWFEERELIEALRLNFLLRKDESAAALALFRQSLQLAAASDVSAAIWLVAEFGEMMRGKDPGLVADAVRSYHDHPEVQTNPKLRKQFAALRAAI